MSSDMIIIDIVFIGGVRRYQLTMSVYIYDQSGCASFVVLEQDSGNFMAVGFYQGHDPNGGFRFYPTLLC